jgi:hypothetical protein
MKGLLCAFLLSLGAWAAEPAPQPAPLTAVLGPVFGSSQFQPGDSDSWFFARPGRSLPAGSMLRTQAGAYCLVLLSDGTKLRLGPLSHLRVVELSADRSELALASGRMEAWVKRRGKAGFKAQTPLFTAVLPEGSFAAELLSADSAVLDVYTGDPEVLDASGRAQKVSPGYRVEFAARTGASTPAPLPSAAPRPEEPSEQGPARPDYAVKAEAAPAATPAKPAPQPVEKKPEPPAKPAIELDTQL